jgi:hypothetical protein
MFTSRGKLLKEWILSKLLDMDSSNVIVLEVRCYACGITHRKWTSRDDPIAIHRRLSPSCSHVINLYSTDGHSYSVSANSEQLSVSSPNSIYYHPNNTLTTSVPSSTRIATHFIRNTCIIKSCSRKKTCKNVYFTRKIIKLKYQK